VDRSRAHAEPPIGEKPVFVGDAGRRRTVLRCIGLGAAAVTAAWLFALLTGAFGIGRLPAVPFPPIGALDEQAPAVRNRVSPKPAPDDSSTADRVAQPGGSGASPGASLREGPSGSPLAQRRRNTSDRRRSSGRTSPGSLLTPKLAQPLSAPLPTTAPSAGPPPRTKVSNGRAQTGTSPSYSTPSGTTNPGWAHRSPTSTGSVPPKSDH
jgi:hypothetical protein